MITFPMVTLLNKSNTLALFQLLLKKGLHLGKYIIRRQRSARSLVRWDIYRIAIVISAVLWCIFNNECALFCKSSCFFCCCCSCDAVNCRVTTVYLSQILCLSTWTFTNIPRAFTLRTSATVDFAPFTIININISSSNGIPFLPIHGWLFR